MNVFDYLDQVQRVCERHSADPGRLTVLSLESSGDMRGRILGRVYFPLPDDVAAYLKVSERIEIRDNVPVRVEYGYFLVIDDAEQWGEERDLSHDPPIHRHGRDHERSESVEVSLAMVLDLAWDSISTYLDERSLG